MKFYFQFPEQGYPLYHHHLKNIRKDENTIKNKLYTIMKKSSRDIFDNKMVDNLTKKLDELQAIVQGQIEWNNKEYRFKVVK